MRRRSSMAVWSTIVALFFMFPAFGQTVDTARLMEQGALPDHALGDAAAPVTIIEYASLTCHHCGNFHKQTWPAVKAKYVDNGKVRFIFREFPLDPLAMGAIMLTRCISDGKWYAMLDKLYQSHESWSHSNDPVSALARVAAQVGMTRAEFDACLRNEGLYENIRKVTLRAQREFGVSSTPTFFINGEKHTGALTIGQLDKILEPILAKAAR